MTSFSDTPSLAPSACTRVDPGKRLALPFTDMTSLSLPCRTPPPLPPPPPPSLQPPPLLPPLVKLSSLARSALVERDRLREEVWQSLSSLLDREVAGELCADRINNIRTTERKATGNQVRPANYNKYKTSAGFYLIPVVSGLCKHKVPHLTL